jgi:hypothetical protein
MSDQMSLKELPEPDSPDCFRILVRNCIETYKELPDDTACLDFNKVSGKLRAMVLDDAEYRQETRNIYAKQRLEELRELNNIANLTVLGDKDDTDPRARGRKEKSVNADKDALAVRFKAAQMRRELLAAMKEDGNVSERDATNMLFVNMSREEIEEVVKNELYEGDSDDALSELVSPKEEAPDGTSGKVRLKGQNRPLGDEDFFETLPNGEVVEK